MAMAQSSTPLNENSPVSSADQTGGHTSKQFETATIDGVRVRYLYKRSDSTEPPLLICNGLGQSIEILFPLIKEIAGRSVIAFDAPGVGRSENAPGVETIPQYARFVQALVDQIGIADFDILGISWGGAVAQQMALDAPGRVRKLVLAITSAGGIGSWWGTPVALSEIMFPMRYMSKSYGNFIGPWMYGGEAILNPSTFKKYSEHAIAPTAEGYFKQVRAMCSWTSLPWLKQLKQPTLILAGQYDTLIPVTNQYLLASHIPNAQMRVFQAGHLLMYTQRQKVGALIGEFLD